MSPMAISNLVGVRSDCGSSNGVNMLLKEFRQDRSIQQDRFQQNGSSKITANGFRSNSSPASSNDHLTKEFFEQEKHSPAASPIFQSSISSPYIQQHHFVAEDWTREFHLQPPSPFDELEQIYQRHNSVSPKSQPLAWSVDELYQHQVASSIASEEEQQMAFERAFEEVTDEHMMHDWDKEFEEHEQWQLHHRHQPLMIPDIQFPPELFDVTDRPMKEFSKYHDPRAVTTEQGKNDDCSQTYKDEQVKPWNRLRPDGKLYGYRAIHPDYETYPHIADNPYLKYQDAIDGLPHTTLSDAILALEAKSQLNSEDAKTWEQLGLKQQENERDTAAITALEKAIALDPSCLDAWLALSVSYTNEHCRMDAYNCLEQWIANNIKYKHIIQEKLGRSYNDAIKRHEYITHLFLEAARASPLDMDPDVQIGLGVLFNMSEEYGKSVDCFKSALISRPHDYQLWNKIGATLAKSRDSMGAIDMYLEALTINPSFVRARYNLGISFMNLGQHREAAEHLLAALSLQCEATVPANEAVVRATKGSLSAISNSTTDSIWGTLRLLMYMMSREDLAVQCDHNNLDVFHGQFDF